MRNLDYRNLSSGSNQYLTCFHTLLFTRSCYRATLRKKRSNEHQPDWQQESTYARQEEGVQRREGGYSGGWWRSLQYRSAESARARAPPQTTAAGLPLQLRKKTSHRNTHAPREKVLPHKDHGRRRQDKEDERERVIRSIQKRRWERTGLLFS